MKLLKKLRCWLGRHDYSYWRLEDSFPDECEVWSRRFCYDCGKVDIIYHKTTDKGEARRGK